MITTALFIWIGVRLNMPMAYYMLCAIILCLSTLDALIKAGKNK